MQNSIYFNFWKLEMKIDLFAICFKFFVKIDLKPTEYFEKNLILFPRNKIINT